MLAVSNENFLHYRSSVHSHYEGMHGKYLDKVIIRGAWFQIRQVCVVWRIPKCYTCEIHQGKVPLGPRYSRREATHFDKFYMDDNVSNVMKKEFAQEKA